MQDCHGRTIDYLRLSVTDRCNFRCRYCMPAQGVEKRAHADILSLDELVEIAGACVRCGVRKIRLTGGEPLLRLGVVDLCRRLRAIPGLDELCLTTNASLLPELALPLRQAGVDRLNISLDTLRPERFAAMTRVGSLDRVRSGVEAALRAGFTELKFDTVLVGGFNDDEIPALARLTQAHPWEIRFIELMPMGPCARWNRGCFLPAETVLERLPELTPVDTQGVSRRYRLPGGLGLVGLISPMSHDFCAQCSRIRVTADGRLKGCLHSREELPLRGLHGQALEEAIRAGILHKPPRHHLCDHPSETTRTMNEIGG